MTIVRFEELVAEPTAVLTPLFESLGLTFTPSVIEIRRVGSSHGPTDEVGLDRFAVGRWRNGGLSDLEIATCEQHCAPLMEQYGFELTGVEASPGARAWMVSSLVFKVVLAGALNARRVGNPIQAVRRRFAVPR